VVHLARPENGVDGEHERRIGFVVARSVGPAVTRNRVKRRLRHLVRERIDALPESVLLVVRAQPAASSASYGELGAALDRCLHRVLEA
jgi:ribonuclease P protein component